MPLAALVVIALGGLALVHAGLLTLQAWEARRFIRSRLRKLGDAQPATLPAWPVLLTVPCKGNELDLADNLRALVTQDYPHYRIHFVVERPDDPACEVIRQVTADARVDCRLIVAGLSSDCGQKVHNLLAGTRDLPPETRIIAFADSDARPKPSWLSNIVRRIAVSGDLCVTGYRWFVPERNTPANLLLHSINASVAGLFGPGGHHLVWGGAWAVRRDVFESTALREAWQGTLSDDLVASRVLHGAGVGVAFEPTSMCLSPIDFTPGRVAEFLRRQFLIGRSYVPRWWLAVLAAVSVTQAAFWGGWAAAAVGAIAGAGWWPWPLANSLALYALAAFRGWLRQDTGRRYFPDLTKSLAAARRFDIWCGPFAATLTWLALLSSIAGRAIAWRGVRYRIDPGGRVLLLGRSPAEPFPSPAALADSDKRHRPRKAS